MKQYTSRLPLRLVAFSVLPLLAAVLGGGVLLLSTIEGAFEQRMTKEVQVVARALQLPLSHAIEHDREGSIHKALESAFNIGGVYGAYLYDARGEVVAAIGRSPSRAGKQEASAVLVQKQRSGKYGDMSGREVYSYFVPLTGPGQRILGLLQVTRRASDIHDALRMVRVRGIWILASAGIVLSLIVLLGYYGAIGRALQRLHGSMTEIQAGKLEHRALQRGPREIVALARAFNGMLDSISDANTKIRSEQRRRDDLEVRLRQSEKLAAIGQLAAGVAHELGTPLSVLDGRAQRALRRDDLHPDVRHAFASIRHEVSRLERIVRQLLDFGRNATGQRSPVRADRVVASTIKMLDREARGRGIELHANPGPPLVVLADSVRLGQALTNIIKNAIHAAQTRVEISWRLNGDSVTWSVDDDGPGVAADIQPRLFEPFFTTKRVGEGTGLGLAITYTVAKEHGGVVEAARSPLGGARFVFCIPQASPDHSQGCLAGVS